MHSKYLCLILSACAACGAALAFAACSAGSGEQTALQSIQAEDLIPDIERLSSDEFQGRAPASPGEEKTVNYLIDRFKALGLEPGNGDSWVQEVPLVEITCQPGSVLAVEGPSTELRFKFGEDYVAQTRQVVTRTGLEGSEMVFAGYGIVAPEYQWNDYEGLDARGKTVIVLVNDPGFATKDTTLFHGTTMTYYGRWTYKYDEAARQGAAGILIVHETEPAAYPWGVVQNSFTGPQMNFREPDPSLSYPEIEGWVTVDAARKIFREAGRDYDQLKATAAERGFRPVPLGLEASVAIDVSHRDVVSRNVCALLPGGARKDEYVIYTAHWDHLGMDTTRTEDKIFNGARDNASAVAGLLEIARAFTKLPKPPERSVLFLSVTCEEQGLLGSQYYADHPIYPLDRTAAVINMDAMNIIGRMKDITVIGLGSSELDDYLVEAAKTQGRVVRPDPEPEKGSYFRSDHFSFAKKGVPSLYAGGGMDHVKYGPEWAKEQSDKFVAERYHKPTDEYDASWDLSGAVDDLRLLFMVGHRVSEESYFPRLKEGGPFQVSPGWRG